LQVSGGAVTLKVSHRRGRADFAENLRAPPFKEEKLTDVTFNQINLVGHHFKINYYSKGTGMYVQFRLLYLF
jgi:hypothetical protein